MDSSEVSTKHMKNLEFFASKIDVRKYKRILLENKCPELKKMSIAWKKI